MIRLLRAWLVDKGAYLGVILLLVVGLTRGLGWFPGVFPRDARDTGEVDLPGARLPLAGKTVALDPGHGGYDPGVVRGEAIEKDINLAISLFLRDYLYKGGARVVMTREVDQDFLEVSAGPRKRLDMENRRVIIGDSRADILISVHCNALAASQWSGAQVFFQEGREEGKILAGYIQEEFIQVLQNTDRQVKGGDYFLLRNFTGPGVIIEAGFLSNPQEAKYLKDPGYQEKLAWTVYLALLRYFEGN